MFSSHTTVEWYDRLPGKWAGRSDSLKNGYVKTVVEEITRRFGELPEFRKADVADDLRQIGRALDEAQSYMPRDHGKNRYRKLLKRHNHAICAVAQRRPWKSRADGEGRSATEWLAEFYGSWIPGLNRNTLRIVDPDLMQAINNQLTNRVGPYTLMEKRYCLPYKLSAVEPAQHIERDRKALQVGMLERLFGKLHRLSL